MATKQSTAGTVLGVMNILFGVLGMCGSVAQIVQFSLIDPNDPNPVFKIILGNPEFQLMLKIFAVLGVVTSILLIVSGIGLLMTKSWGRTLALFYAYLQVLMAVMGIVVNYIFLLQPLMAEAQQGGPEGAAAVGGIIGGIIGGCLGTVYPVIIIIVLMQRSVREAFRPEIAHEEADFADDFR